MTTTVSEARDLATRLLRAAGMGAEQAYRSAWAIVLADCWELGSHGLMRLPHYLRRLSAGGCRPDATLSTVVDTGPLVSLDGHDGLGHWQVWRAAELAAKRCAEYGVAVTAVGRSSHCGALGVYTLPLIRAGYAGLVFSNGPAVMPPWNGDRPVVSTSPIAAGFPAGEPDPVNADPEPAGEPDQAGADPEPAGEPDQAGADPEPAGPAPGRPVIVDLATSAVARGKIAQRAATGEPLPEGWAFDSAGTPTTDPAAALAGMLAPLGGAKGFALAFLVEALTGGLVGPALSADVVDMFAPEHAARPQRIAHLVVALDPARTAVDGAGTQRLRTLADLVREAGGRTPGQRRTPPDEIADDAPVSIPAGVAAELTGWASRLGV